MKTKPLWLALCLVLSAAFAAAEDSQQRAAQFQRLAILHLQLLDHGEKLSGAVSQFQKGVPSKEQFLKLSQTLEEMPPELDEYSRLQTGLGKPDDEQLVIRLKDELKKARELRRAYLSEHPEIGLPAGDPSSVASIPGPQLPSLVKQIKEDLAQLTSGGEKRFPILAKHSNEARVSNPGTAVQPVQGVRTGTGVLKCAGAFDGAGCGPGAVTGPGSGKDKNLQRTAGGQGATRVPPVRKTAASNNPGATGTGVVKNGGTSSTAASRTVQGSGSKSTVSGANPRLDQTAVPGLGTASKTADPRKQGRETPAPKPPPSRETIACQNAVNGPDPNNPEHSTIAGMCENHSFIAPVLAGLLDAVKEQFGTITGILLNLFFLLLGLLMSVATGGVALILKLVGLVFAGWAILSMLWKLAGAVNEIRNATDPEAKARGWRTVGAVGGGLLIMIAMALVGYKVGKSEAGAAKIKAMEGGMTAAMDKFGITAMMEGINKRIPAPVVAALEKVFGKAPERGGKTAEPKPEEKPKVPEEKTKPKDPVVEEGPPPTLRARLKGVVDRVFGRDGAGRAARIAGKIRGPRQSVAAELEGILKANLADSAGEMTPQQYNRLLAALKSYAHDNGVELKSGDHWLWELVRKGRSMGVYPKSVNEIDLVAFGDIKPRPEWSQTIREFVGLDPARKVSPARLHELFHIFHAVQMRVTLLRGGVGVEEAEGFLAAMENGGNYLELEKAATNIGSPIHAFVAEARSPSRYVAMVSRNIKLISEALGTGEIKIPFRWSWVEVYSWTISRAPIVLGQSVKEMVGRMGVICFANLYSSNAALSDLPWLKDVDPQIYKSLGIDPKKDGFRDLINAAIMHDKAP